MPAVHHQRLLVRHGGQILHREAVLRPVLENGPVSAVDDEFVRVLRHPLVQVVLDHGHDGRRLLCAGGVLVHRPGVYLIGGPIAVHVDASVVFELLCKLRGQLRVKGLREVPQGVFERQHLLFRLQDVLPLGRMVDFLVIGLGLRQLRRNASENLFLKPCHAERSEESIVRYAARQPSGRPPPAFLLPEQWHRHGPKGLGPVSCP